MPPQLPITLFSILFLWLLEGRFFYWPLPKNRRQHGLVNLLLGIVSLGLLAAVAAGATHLSFWARENHFGLLNWIKLPLVPEAALGMVLYDLGNYWIHRVQHIVPALWRVHRAHHTDPYIDVTSAFRFHPIETLFRGGCFLVLVTLGGISPWAVLGYGTLASLGLTLSHANLNIPPSWESWSQYGVVLPLQHRLHHSQKREEHDRNFAIVFLWWDHLFGTYLSPTRVRDLNIGIQGVGTDRSERLAGILLEPLKP